MIWPFTRLGRAPIGGAYMAGTCYDTLECLLAPPEGYGNTRDAIIELFKNRIKYEYHKTKDKRLLELDCNRLFENYSVLHGEPYRFTHDVELLAREFIEYQITVMLPAKGKEEKVVKSDEMKEIECKFADVMSCFNGDKLALFKWLLDNLGEKRIKALKASDVLTVMIPDNDFYDYTQDVGKPYGRIVNELDVSCKVKYVSEADMLRDEIKKIEKQMESLKQEKDSLLEKLKEVGEM